jgi:nicotinamidase-related amidase
MRTNNNDIRKLKEIKELLIVIDMVNGFVKEGPLAAPSIKRIVPRQIQLLEEALESETTGIIFIRDSHKENAVEFNTYGRHCIEGTKETEIIDEMKKYEKYSLEYLKNSTNLIFAPNIQKDIKSLDKLEKIRIMGCLSEVCVQNGAISLKTFLDQINKKVEVCVHSDAIDTYDASNHNADQINKNAIQEMQKNGIKIL